MVILFRPIILLCTALLGGCVLPTRDNWVPSPNFNGRRPNYVIIHQTDSVSHARALDTLTNPLKQVSAHYLIAKDGHITQLVDENNRAWHAGKSYWGGQTDMNSASIGIELDHYGDAPFEPAQVDSLLALLDGLGERHHIPVANYLGHGDVALGRKVDPNHLFPWDKLAARGFGLWCSNEEIRQESRMPETLLSLQALGYDIGKPEDAIAAFRRHFRGTNIGTQLDDQDLRMLACLLTKKSAPAGGTTLSPRNSVNGQ